MVAQTGVRGTRSRAAAMPVGAPAFTVWPLKWHQRKSVSKRKLFPVPALACRTRRRGLSLALSTAIASE